MLPQKVREAAERAEQIHRQVYGNTETAPVKVPGAEAAPPSEPPAAPPAVLETPQVPAAPAEPPVVQTANWEEKYRVLDGKYKAEVPRMAQEIRGLKDTIEELRTTVTKATAPPPASPVPIPTEGMTLKQVEETFGEDWAKAVVAIAAQIADDRVTRVRQDFQPQLESVEKRSAETARDSFIRELTTLVPDWQQIDTDDNFTVYLDEVDELSGRSRRQFFSEADKRNDARRVAKFFTTFKGNSTAPAPTAPPAATNPAVEALLQPSTTRVTEVPKGKKVWASADIRQFYVDVRRGRYTPQETQRIESDIFAAQRENRLAA